MAPQSKHHQPDPADPPHNESARSSEPAAPAPKRSNPKKQNTAPTNADSKSNSGKRSPSAKASKTEITPSMAQFLEIKAANPDSVLWYRMGDFYELFFDDAVVVSKALSITLTKRGRHLGEDIPMCGVPVVRADEYLHKLISQGFRVAVCEQLEDPAEARKRGSKAVVHRDVVRLVTPGTITEDNLLDARSRNFLSALFVAPSNKSLKSENSAKDATKSRAETRAKAALASIDISTGEFEVGLIAWADLPGELVRLDPRELIVPDTSDIDPEIEPVLEMLKTAITPVPNAYFNSLNGERDLKAQLKLKDIGAFGTFERTELAAVGALLKYVDLTQIGAKPFLRPPRRTSTDDVLLIDAASRASLELTRSISGDKHSSLLSAIDHTLTGPGTRELAARLASPLRDKAEIDNRLDALTFLIENPVLRLDIRATIKTIPDIARAVSRLAFARGSPRDQGNVRDGLRAALECASLLSSNAGAIGLPNKLENLKDTLSKAPADLYSALTTALIELPTPNKRDGGFIAPGFCPELDEALKLKETGRQLIAELEAKYAQFTGIKSLKIRHNNILGYFIEVRQANATELMSTPLSETFRHRQTMANAARFTTTELVETEAAIATSAERAANLEQEIFTGLSKQIAANEHLLGATAAALADIDVTAALAELAHEDNYVRPHIDNGRSFVVKGGRHPVVEKALQANRQNQFIENDCVLTRPQAPENSADPQPPGFDDDSARNSYLWLVTGPNMAGKSTFLRQNALIAILAQMGSYVPARQAHIGIIDRLFSRVGAADDLARGRSTFMVEMVETASILNLATDRSFVILDEIGRGTATFDGLSIAWACVEYLHEAAAARTLFATHYHELTILPERLPGVANVTIDVKEWRDEIIFLHKVKPGAADRSYGIQVAKLAGLPADVIKRAQEVLTILEAHDQAIATTSENPLDELPLFSAVRPVNPVSSRSKPSAVEQAIGDMNPDELTPRAALEALYHLKKLHQDD